MKRILLIGVSVFAGFLAITQGILGATGSTPDFRTYLGMTMAVLAVTDFIVNRRYTRMNRLLKNPIACGLFSVGMLLCFGGLGTVMLSQSAPEAAIAAVVVGLLMILTARWALSVSPH